MSDLIERLHDVAAASRNHDGETDALIEATNTIERLTAETEYLADVAQAHVDVTEIQRKRIAKLERVLEAATNLVRAEGWQIERDNLWDTLHDLIDAEDEALADMEQT